LGGNGSAKRLIFIEEYCWAITGGGAGVLKPIKVPVCCSSDVNWTALYKDKTAVWKVSNHFEYFENRSRGFDVTWQPVRRDLTVHPWTVILPWG